MSVLDDLFRTASAAPRQLATQVMQRPIVGGLVGSYLQNRAAHIRQNPIQNYLPDLRPAQEFGGLPREAGKLLNAIKPENSPLGRFVTGIEVKPNGQYQYPSIPPVIGGGGFEAATERAIGNAVGSLAPGLAARSGQVLDTLKTSPLAGQAGFLQIPGKAGAADVSQFIRQLADNNPAIKLRNINQLVSHEGAPDLQRVEHYIEQLRNGQPIQPLMVIPEGRRFGVEDGKHRLEALRRLGVREIPVVERPAAGAPQRSSTLMDLFNNEQGFIRLGKGPAGGSPTGATPPKSGIPDSSGPSIPNGIASDKTPPITVKPPKKAGLLQQAFNRARNVIAQQGEAGKQLAQGLQEARDMAETTAGTWVSRLPTVRSLSKQDFVNFVDVAEGKAEPISEKVAKAAAEWATVREEIHATAQASGLDIGKLEDYFPHIFDKQAFEGDNYVKAIQHLVETGQAKDQIEAATMLRHAQDVIRNRRHANLELERIVNLPGYEKTKEALFGYIESAANRIAQVNHFGLKDEKALALINRIGQEGGDASTTKELFDISVGAKQYGETQQAISRALRGFNATTKLGLGALTNVGQNVNTATVTGSLRTALAGGKAFTKEAQDFALKAGVTLDGVLSDLREGAGFSGKVLGKITAPGFNKVERFNRTVAAWAGKGYAEDLAKQAANGSKRAMDGLRRMGLDADTIAKRGGTLTEDEQITAARNIVERTQFKVDPQDLPGWASSPWGKVVTQFRTFSYNQTAFIGRELIQPALRGDVVPLVRFLALALPTGAAIKETRNLLQNRPSEEDPRKRIVQYYQQAGGLGLASDVVTGLFPMNGKYLPQDRAVSLALGTIGGPTVGTIADAYGSLTQAVQGNPTSLQRFALRQVPIVGPTLQNTLLPYKPGGRDGSSALASSDGKKAKKSDALDNALAMVELIRNGQLAGSGKSGIGKLTTKQQKALISEVRKLATGKGNIKRPSRSVAEPPKGISLPSVSSIHRKAAQPVRRLSRADIERITQIVRRG